MGRSWTYSIDGFSIFRLSIAVSHHEWWTYLAKRTGAEHSGTLQKSERSSSTTRGFFLRRSANWAQDRSLVRARTTRYPPYFTTSYLVEHERKRMDVSLTIARPLRDYFLERSCQTFDQEQVSVEVSIWFPYPPFMITSCGQVPNATLKSVMPPWKPSGGLQLAMYVVTPRNPDSLY